MSTPYSASSKRSLATLIAAVPSIKAGSGFGVRKRIGQDKRRTWPKRIFAGAASSKQKLPMEMYAWDYHQMCFQSQIFHGNRYSACGAIYEELVAVKLASAKGKGGFCTQVEKCRGRVYLGSTKVMEMVGVRSRRCVHKRRWFSFEGASWRLLAQGWTVVPCFFSRWEAMPYLLFLIASAKIVSVGLVGVRAIRVCDGMLALRPGVGATGHFSGSTEVNKLLLSRRPNKTNCGKKQLP